MGLLSLSLSLSHTHTHTSAQTGEGEVSKDRIEVDAIKHQRRGERRALIDYLNRAIS